MIVKAPPIKRKLDGKLVEIPGGWNIIVPEPNYSGEAFDYFVNAHIKRGTPLHIANHHARESMREFWCSAWRRSIVDNVWHKAKLYHKRHPDKLQRDLIPTRPYTLVGFDAQLIQATILPGTQSRSPGRYGDILSRRLMAKMANDYD